MVSPGFHSAASLVHLSWLCVAIRESLAALQFLLCLNPVCDVVCQHSFISFSRASFLCNQSSFLSHLLGLLCCHHHHRMRYCWLGRIHRVCCLLLEYPRIFHRHECLFSNFYFIFVFSFLSGWVEAFCAGRCGSFSCSLVVVHVPAPYATVGVTTAWNRCSRCRSNYDWDVSSCRCLAKADHAHRIRYSTSVVTWSTNVIVCPRYFTFPLRKSISTCILSMSTFLVLFVLVC